MSGGRRGWERCFDVLEAHDIVFYFLSFPVKQDVNSKLVK